jgi:hypothetical protein
VQREGDKHPDRHHEDRRRGRYQQHRHDDLNRLRPSHDVGPRLGGNSGSVGSKRRRSPPRSRCAKLALWGQVSHMKKSRPDQAERGSEPRRRSPKSGGKIRWVRHNPRDKAARLPSSTDAGYQALLLGRRVGAGNSPAGVDLTGMSNPNIPRENPDAPLT